MNSYISKKLILVFVMMISKPVLSDEYHHTTGVIKNVRVVIENNRPSEIFITLENDKIYSAYSKETTPLANGMKVKLYLPKDIIKRDDNSLTICAINILALPMVINGKESLFPLTEKQLFVPIQQDGCNFK